MTRKAFVFLTLLTLGAGILLWGCNASLEAAATQEASSVLTEATALATSEETDATVQIETPTVPMAGATPMGNGVPGGPGRGQGHGPGRRGQGLGGPPEGRGPENPWRPFHQMPVPEEYATLTNPIPADEASIARGEEVYQTYCASCHGETGLGDGPVADTLTPPPAPLAHTASRMSDGYLYWRIAEDGIQFGTAMPSFETALTEEDIWHTINFLRSLSAEADVQANQRLQEALTQAVNEGVITQEEADLFLRVHNLIEAYRQEHRDELRGQGTPGSAMDIILQGLVASGPLTQDEAQRFQEIFQKLNDAQLLP